MALDDSGIRYLVVGGIAVSFHGEPRFTKNLDLLITVSPAEAVTLYECLKAFGAPLQILSPEELSQPDFIFHFGVPPWRVDVISSIPGVQFEDAYASRVKMPLAAIRRTAIRRNG